MTDDEVEQQKDIQFYGVAINAWVSTAVEHDRSLMTLSAGGIGLLVTLLSTVGVGSIWLLGLYIAAMLSLFVCVVAVLVVFHQNRHHIKRVLREPTSAPDQLLATVDVVARRAFAVGAMLLILIGISTAWLSFEIKTSEARMTNERVTREGTVDLGKSLNGIGNLRPTTGNAPASTPAQSPAPASTPAQQSTNNTGDDTSGAGK